MDDLSDIIETKVHINDFFDKIKSDERYIGSESFEHRRNKNTNNVKRVKNKFIHNMLKNDDESTFCIYGSMIAEDNIFLSLNDKQWDLKSLNSNELLEECLPALFGNISMQQTEYNPEVRKAKCCSNFSFLKDNSEIDLSSSLYSNIKKHLLNGNNLNIKKNKLNIYQKGDFFLPHVDTPSSDLMVATCILFLPTVGESYDGGQLIIKHNDLEQIIDFENNNEINYVVFYSNCIHEVLPVVSGIRISVTYDVFLNINNDDILNSNFSEVVSCNLGPTTNHLWINMFNKLKKYIKHHDYKNDKYDYDDNNKIKFGLLLSNEYTLKNLTVDKLVGIDRKIYDNISNIPNSTITLSSVIYEYIYDTNYDYKNDKYVENIKKCCVQYFLIDNDDWKYYMLHKKIKKINNKQYYNFISMTNNNTGTIINKDEESGYDYMGNSFEVSDDSNEYKCILYFNAVLLVTIN